MRKTFGAVVLIFGILVMVFAAFAALALVGLSFKGAHSDGEVAGSLVVALAISGAIFAFGRSAIKRARHYQDTPAQTADIESPDNGKRSLYANVRALGYAIVAGALIAGLWLLPNMRSWDSYSSLLSEIAGVICFGVLMAAVGWLMERRKNNQHKL